MSMTFNTKIVAAQGEDVSSGATLDTSPATLKIKTINAPTTSGGSSYGPGSNQQVLMSNGSTIYWGTGGSSSEVTLDGVQTFTNKTLDCGTY